jgi:hypothetical protein
MYSQLSDGHARFCHPLNGTAFLRRIDKGEIFPFPHISGRRFPDNEVVSIRKRAG